MYEVVRATAATVASFSFCGYSDSTGEGHRRKCAWLRARMEEGLRFLMLRSGADGDVGMIEYAPGPVAWRPVRAPEYLVIHCIMVLRRHAGKGGGRLLLDACLTDARENQFGGVAVVTSSDSFMAKPALFLKNGFDCVDRRPPYELLVRRLRPGLTEPRFASGSGQPPRLPRRGLIVLSSDQCPMVCKCTRDILDAAQAMGLEPHHVPVSSAEESRGLPTPYGNFCILQDGRVLSARPVSATRFRNLVRAGESRYRSRATLMS
ncbi:MAG: GNAT family N-acetyltransferase [Candidatus Riflebacteria bacterium]|nr:GNAT family N-acetyltransferase [Candidatus Riflebacteria bacterium]